MMTKIDKLVFEFTIIIINWIVLRRFYKNRPTVIYILYWKKNWFKECNKYIDIHVYLYIYFLYWPEKKAVSSPQRKPAQETHNIYNILVAEQLKNYVDICSSHT